MPLLSDDQLSGIPDTPEPDPHARDGADWLNWWGARQDAVPMTGRAVRDFYEGLITSGELRVVKKVEPIIVPYRHISGTVHPKLECPVCHTDVAPFGIGSPYNYFKFCPGCGSEILRAFHFDR